MLRRLLLLTAIPAFAQHQFTTDDYARAEKFMTYNTTPLVYRSGVRPTWLDDERFFYRVTTAAGTEFVLVDPAHGNRGPAFDHAKLAAALSAATGTGYDAHHLPFTEFEMTGDHITANAGARRWSCDVMAYKCTDAGEATRARGRGGRGGGNEVFSPDKTRAAFLRGDNLWSRDVATGKETQVTTDGVKDFGYATDNAGWTKSDRPILLWSPDSKKIATFEQDQRGVGEMYLVNTTVGHPKLDAWKYPLPGDDVVTTIQRVVIDADSKHVTRFKIAPDQHRSTICDNIA